MNHKRLNTIILAIACVLLLFSSFAFSSAETWIRTQTVGHWDLEEFGHWNIQAVAGNNYTQAITEYKTDSIPNFSGYRMEWNISQLGAYLPPWWWVADGAFNYAFAFTGADGTTLYTNGQFGYTIHATDWGWFSTAEGVNRRASFGIQDYWFERGIQLPTQSPYDTTLPWGIYVSRVGNNVTFQFPKYGVDLTSYFDFGNGWEFQTGLQGAASVKNIQYDNKYVNFTFTEDQNWFSNVTVTLWVGWQGYPGVDIYLDTQAYVNGATPILPPLPSGPILPNEPDYGILGDLYNFFVMLWNIVVSAVTFLIAMVQAFWPLFPLMAVVYLVDMFWTSYQKGGFVAIGDTFYKLYELVIQTAQMAIHALQAIGEYLVAGIKWVLALFGIIL